MGIPTPTMTAATPHIAVFLTSDKIKCLEFIYHKLYTKLPLCMSRMLSQLHSLHWANFTAQRNCFYTGRSDNISWLFIQLHLTNCCFARNIWDHLLLQPEMGGLIWHINLGFVAPRFVPAGNRFFPYHLSYQLCTTGFITCKHLTSSFRCSKASQYISLQSSEIYAVTLCYGSVHHSWTTDS